MLSEKYRNLLIFSLIIACIALAVYFIFKNKESYTRCSKDDLVCDLDCGTKGSDNTYQCSGKCQQCFADTDCPTDFRCTNNSCVAIPCIPDCTGKKCGSDGCSGSCGTCGANEYCDSTGVCAQISRSPVKDWFTEDLFDQISPYAGISQIFTDDGLPLYTYQGFIDALDFMETLPEKVYHGFASSSTSDINKKELAAFFGNSAQETGTGSTGPRVPNPNCSDAPVGDTCKGKWLQQCSVDGDCAVSGSDCKFVCGNKQCQCASGVKPKWDAPDPPMCGWNPGPPDPSQPPNGSFGTGSAAIEGVVPQFEGAKGGCGTYVSLPINNANVTKRLGGCTDLCLQNIIKPVANESRGLKPEVVPQDGGCLLNTKGSEDGFGNFACVSSDGTMWQGNPSTIKNTNPDTKNLFTFKTFTEKDKNSCADNDPSCRCLPGDMSCEYVGRGPTQLTGNSNYSDCSMSFFGDLRLIRWPNLITTTDRSNPYNQDSFFLKNCEGDGNTCKSILGFPGSGPPDIILNTTPPARTLIWATTLWFWMNQYRSGFNGISCHDSMMNPDTMGIACVTQIVNATACSGQGDTKGDYYRAICKVLGVIPDENVCPLSKLNKKCNKGGGGGSSKCPAFGTEGAASTCWDTTGAFTQDGNSCCCPYKQAPDNVKNPTKCSDITGNQYKCDKTSKTCSLVTAGTGDYLTKSDCAFACNPPVDKCASSCPNGCLMADGTCISKDQGGNPATVAMCTGWDGYWCGGTGPTPSGPCDSCGKGCVIPGGQCIKVVGGSPVNKNMCDGWSGQMCS